jgi:hypothetical protein
MESHKQSWLSTVLARMEKLVSSSRRKQSRPQTPAEINPLPDDRAFDREANIEFLKENYPKREYRNEDVPAPQPDNQPEKIEKDKPLRGFHGG